MQVSQDVFRFVPLQDFTSKSDIDWSKSIPEIDQQLYAKYSLSEDEISFITYSGAYPFTFRQLIRV